MENAIEQKSFHFSVRIVRLCDYLRHKSCDYAVVRQLIRCGTSIGANVAEAQEAQSRADFAAKLNIDLKETAETAFWLRLLKETNYLKEEEFQSIFSDCVEIKSLLISILKTVRG